MINWLIIIFAIPLAFTVLLLINNFNSIIENRKKKIERKQLFQKLFDIEYEKIMSHPVSLNTERVPHTISTYTLILAGYNWSDTRTVDEIMEREMKITYQNAMFDKYYEHANALAKARASLQLSLKINEQKENKEKTWLQKAMEDIFNNGPVIDQLYDKKSAKNGCCRCCHCKKID